MSYANDHGLYSALTIAIAAVGVAYLTALVARVLGRRYEGLRLGLPLAVGLAARFATIAGVDGTGLSARLRGGDEQTFLENSRGLARLGWTDSHWVHTTLHELHTAVFAVQAKLLDFGPTAMRLTQVGIAVLGLLLLVAAVYELAGPAAARLAAWVVMLEPAGIFFDSSIHKEPLMVLASGLTVFGATKLWRHLDLRGVVVAAAGCGVAIATRSYAGWFLVGACAVLAFHGAVRRMDHPVRALPLVYLVVLGGFLAWPTLLAQSSPHNLKRLQTSQDYNTADAYKQQLPEGEPTSNGNNLAFERVDYSTRAKLVMSLPQRIRDVVLRPYPWQLQNASQALGAIGSLVALGGMLLLLSYMWRLRGQIFHAAGPMLYPIMFLLVAYSLSAGNAGTSFRYRTHIVTLALATLVVLRTHSSSASARQPTRDRRRTRFGRAVRVRVTQPVT